MPLQKPCQPRIAVLYLAREAEGITPLQIFMESYASYPPGIEHDLIVISKGLNTKYNLENIEKECPFPHTTIEVNDDGFDIGSYIKAAEQIPYEYICCLNTFSKILTNNWLQKLFSHAAHPDVGIVGATGSYESNRDSMTLIQKVLWFSSQSQTSKSLQTSLNKYFKFILHPKHPRIIPLVKIAYEYINRLISRGKDLRELDNFYKEWWKEAQEKDGIAQFIQFPPFPNPHIRSNAFMIKRELFLSFTQKAIKTKWDACYFESGYDGMTRQILKAQLKALIIDKNGEAYDIENWSKSKTFRLGIQDNLLITDNQTQFYYSASYETQLVHSLMTWGEGAIQLPYDFPNLGIHFL